MGVMNKTSSIETTITGTEDNQRTYEIVKELKGDVKAKEDVILIQVFPTISPEDCTTSDVTTFHLVNKMKDLGWKKVHILNIFSCVSKERLKARDLMSVDEENMLYIKKRFAALGKDVKVIIAWGNNLLSNKVANQSKLRILETYRKLYPNQKLSDMFLQLHISERTGRGVPKITEVYGKETYEFRENSIVVSIPFTRVQVEEMPTDEEEMTQNVSKMTLDEIEMTPDVSKMTLDNGVNKKRKNSEKYILEFCVTPKSILEIAEFLGLKEKKSARRHVKPLVEQGRLAMTLPEKPNSKNQKYITIR